MDIKVTIKELGESDAVLKFEDGRTAAWPIELLPKDCQVGDVLDIRIRDNGSEKEPEQLAKDLLNEILNIE